MNLLKGLLSLLLAWSCISLMAQGDPIRLTNPSFEDIPHIGNTRIPIRGWFDCGLVRFPMESPPDIQPSGFGVTRPAQHGGTYLGMVVRDNDSYESVSQRISRSLLPGQCYEFSVYLSRSLSYKSISQATRDSADFITPAKLRIFGGSSPCQKAELLDESPLVSNSDWKKYSFRFEPAQRIDFIILEAFFKTPTLIPYNGHILVDNASEIVPIPCQEPVEEGPVVVLEEPPEKNEDIRINQRPGSSSPTKEPTPPEPKEELSEKTPNPSPPPVQSKILPPKEKTMPELDRATIKKGQIIRVDKLHFEADTSHIDQSSYPVLEEIYDFLNENEDVMVEIGGHTNTIPSHEYCNRLSSQRAKAVVEYLIEKGISKNRLQYKGYGKTQPIVKNDRYNMEARRLNQRVEIKILSING